MKILICDGMHESGLQLLRKEADIDVDSPAQPSIEKIKEMLPHYDGMVVRSRTKVTEELLNHAPKLKVIGRAGIGTDNIDVNAASVGGVLVMNTPGANAMAAAEHTLALMLSLARHVPQATQSMRKGLWEKKRFTGTELYQQVLGIVGLGSIGSIVAKRALGMEMTVLGYDPHVSREAMSNLGVEPVALEDLFIRSDIITLHIPRTPETENIINQDTIATMKRGVRIINCARGGLIDEAALHDSLVDGHVAGAALDVFAQEPPGDNPLLNQENVICTPHLGAASVQAQANVGQAIASQILDYLKNGIIRNAVNFPSISLRDFERIRPYLLLAERLGSLQGQLCTPFDRVEIEYSGQDLLKLPLQPITQTLAKGLLDPVLSEKVNSVNAPLLLKERGIDLVASNTSEDRGYSGLIGVRVHGSEGFCSVAGTVFPGNELRLIRLYDYRLEAPIEGINLIVQNLDKPGMIGYIGATLGNHGTNIADMHLSRTPQKDKAIALIRLDSEAPQDALTILRDNQNIISVRQIMLPKACV